MSKRLAVTDSIAFAFGFAWQALDPVESKGAKFAELMGQGNKSKASFKNNQAEYLGVSKDGFEPLPKIKTLAGAALMANHPHLAGKTVWIVMEEPLPDEPEEDAGAEVVKQKAIRTEMVVVGLVKGNIVVDDFVNNQEGYKRLYGVFVSRANNAKATYTTVGTSYTLGQLAEHYTWEDFLPNKANKPVPVTTLEPSMYGRVLVGVGAVVAVACVVWGYVAWENAQKAKAERERRERERRNLPALYTASVAELLDQPVLRANSAFAELRNHLRAFPIGLEGWNLSEIECIATTAACNATWSNEKGRGTNRGFANAAPKEWGTVTFAPDGKHAYHAMPFKLTPAKLPAQDTWMHDRDFLMKPFSQWQSYWIVGFHPELDVAPHVVGLIPGLDESTASELPNVVWARKWTIKATPWYLSDGFDRAAEKGDGNLPDSVTVDHIDLKVDADKQLKFDAEGAIYESK